MRKASIRQVPADRSDLFVFEIDGRIHKPDIEWMARTLKEAFEAKGTVDILILMTNWDGIDAGAVFDGESLSAQAEANTHVRKYAVVGAPAWASAMIHMFSPLTPVEEKTFDLAEAQQAWAWVDQGIVTT